MPACMCAGLHVRWQALLATNALSTPPHASTPATLPASKADTGPRRTVSGAACLFPVSYSGAITYDCVSLQVSLES